jgi:hypothetical protein
MLVFPLKTRDAGPILKYLETFEKFYPLSIYNLSIFIQMEERILLPKTPYLFFIRAELLLPILHVILLR